MWEIHLPDELPDTVPLGPLFMMTSLVSGTASRTSGMARTASDALFADDAAHMEHQLSSTRA